MSRPSGQAGSDSTEPAAELTGIVKRFPGVVACDGAGLRLEAGEVHALLGENGAGKTTLMSVLAGIYRPDGGRVEVAGRPVDFKSPKGALEAGIGMVHQHFRLVGPLSVAENVLLGSRGAVRMSRSGVEKRVAELADSYSLRVKPDAKVWQLSVGEQQRVEILKALFRRAKILILDEPTAVLTPQEAEHLFAILRQMAGEGRSVVFISHKLDEVTAVADRITVLRAGRTVATLAAGDATTRELARLMVGREVSGRLEREERAPGPERLAVRSLSAEGDLGTPALREVTLTARAGEILGIAGVAGNGQRELTEVIAGIRPASSGTVAIAGTDVSGASPAQRLKAGLAYVPEDRLGMGLVGDMDCVDNLMLKRLGDPGLRRGPLIDRRAAEAGAGRLVESFGVKTPSLRSPVRLMSGGNVQKLLLARELSSNPEVLIVSQPTAGLDVGATQAIRKLLLEERDRGVAVLVVGEDLDELLALCDRIAVMYEGRVIGVLGAHEADRERVGMMMAGSTAGAT